MVREEKEPEMLAGTGLLKIIFLYFKHAS